MVRLRQETYKRYISKVFSVYEGPKVLRDFLTYHESIRGHSPKTVDEYYLDLRTFFRFLKINRGLAPDNAVIEEIPIDDVDLDFLAKVTLSEVYDYLAWLNRERVKNPKSAVPEYGLKDSARARKVATLRSFFKYLTVKTNQLASNPIEGIDSPKVLKSLPRFLTLEESEKLLTAISGRHEVRDYCIICLFLNCGLRISEIVGLNLTDIRKDHLRIVGKGNKERVVFLNDATAAAINDYLQVRKNMECVEPNAVFVTDRKTRMTRAAVHAMVKKSLLQAGLDPERYSAHKLRHTAATLMLQNGVDVRTLQELLGHDHLNTTQIYTHVDNTELRIAAEANPLAEFIPNQ